MPKHKVYKYNGKPQKASSTLTLPIANALRQRVLDGLPIFSDTNKENLPLMIEKDGEMVEYSLSIRTLNKWIARRNVVKETGDELRTILDEARQELRERKRRERRDKMLEESEAALHRVVRLRTSQPVRNMFGEVIKDENGKIVRKENHNLLRIKTDTAKFITERLDPHNYGKLEKTENKHLVFSLADLRQAHENREQ